MGAPRKVEWERVRAFAARNPYVSRTDIGKVFGISDTTVTRILASEDERAELNRRSRLYLEASRWPCENPACANMTWARYRNGRSGLCQDCFNARRRAEHVSKHGTEGEYSHGCRCPACREASRLARARRRARASREDLG